VVSIVKTREEAEKLGMEYIEIKMEDDHNSDEEDNLQKYYEDAGKLLINIGTISKEKIKLQNSSGEKKTKHNTLRKWDFNLVKTDYEVKVICPSDESALRKAENTQRTS
jgi:hypothetical protein